MAEIIFSSVVLLICASSLVILGIVQYRSKEPVGFWSGKKPPRREEITDVRAYNRKHGLIWIFYGAGLVLCFACGIPFGWLAAACLCMTEVFGGLIVMAVYHRKLERVYRAQAVDTDIQKPVLRCSICTGEQVAGFKNLNTGKFEEVMLIKNEKDLEEFMSRYGISEVSKEY